MNKALIILLSVLLSLQLIESKPRYGSRYWRKFVRSSIESSEEDSFETNIGNGYNNRNVIYKNSENPNYREIQGQTESYQPIDNQSENEGQFVAGNGYRTPSKPIYNSFGGNELQGGDESNYNQRPNVRQPQTFRPNVKQPQTFRPNVKQIRDNRRPYNDYETNYNRKKSSEIGDFGNGHDNTNTFNIHKKEIYIS